MIGLDECAAPSACPDLFLYALPQFRAAPRDDHVRAFFCKEQGSCLANTRCSTGNDGDLILQSFAHKRLPDCASLRFHKVNRTMAPSAAAIPSHCLEEMRSFNKNHASSTVDPGYNELNTAATSSRPMRLAR